MEREILMFFKIWGVAIASASCAYYLTLIPKGIPRLVFILPIIYLFTVLPFSLSFFHLSGPTIFYLVWLGNFKLLLFSFHLGPLSTLPNKSLPHFIAVALLPIKVNDHGPDQPVQSPTKKVNDHGPDQPIQSPIQKVNLGRSVLFGVKLVALALVVKIYEFRQELPQYVLLVNQCCHIYLGVELTLALSAALVRATLGLDSDPQFDEPYLATSLQDFWGRRWNLMVSNILRLSVHGPIRRVASPFVGRRRGLFIAGLAAFLVSGLMHELIYFYFTRVAPTWEVTWFFVLHGVCTMGEIGVKEVVGTRFKLHRSISGPLTIGFVGITGWWLFLPQILRNGVDERAVSEYPMMVKFVKENVLRFRS